MIDQAQAANVMAAALETGGDFCELFFETSRRNSLMFLNGEAERAASGITHGCGIRVFSGRGAVYAYTNDTSPENLIKVAREASQAVKAIGKPGSISALSALAFENAHPVKVLPNEARKADIAGLFREAAEASKSFDSRIAQTMGGYGDVVTDVLIVNSEGLWAEDRRVRTRVSVQAVAASETEKQTGYFAPGASMGFEFFETLDMKKLGQDAAECAVKMLMAKPCPPGVMPVVIGNGFGGVIFHEACGHSLEATSVAKNASEFAGRLGETIASPIVTAVDDGTIGNYWGSTNIDDEGALARKNVLIENGVLKSYLIDKLNGWIMGMAPTGSSRRESYKFAPTSRMTNTYIAPGESSPEQIIAATEYGLYAKKMGGGSVEPATGDFNFAVTESHMIRNGKIAEPVRGATLIGKGAQVLLDIDMVADDLALSAGVCGSESGAVPTTVGQPTIRVKGMTVGGRA